MKRTRLLLVVFGLIMTVVSSGQTTLTFRLANVNIMNSGGTDYFAFDIQVKAATAGSFLFSGQAVLSFDNANLSTSGGDWSVVNGSLLAGTFGIGNNKYNTTLLSLTGSPLKVNIAWTANSGSVGALATSAKFNEITTSYATLVTVFAPITNTAGMAGMDFDETSMNGQQSYKLDAAPWYASYNSPNLYDAADFMNTYLGRIFASGAWTQAGGSLNWTAPVGTSVWDGNGTVPGGSLSNASALRIHAGATLTIPVNGKLTVTGNTDIVTAGGLRIVSDASGTGSLITGSASGLADVQRYMVGSATAWHLIAAPVVGQDIPLFVGNTGINDIAYNGTLDKYGLATYVNDAPTPGWVHFTSTTLPIAGPFVSGKGYEVLRNSNGTVTFTGTLATDPVSQSVTNSATGKWWNLVGNPYSSAINANSFAGTNNFLTANDALFESGYHAVYIWNQPNNSYDIINSVSGATYIPLGQAFFVKPVSGGGTASFTANMRTHQTAAAFKSVESTWPSINVKASIAGNNKNTMVYYIPGTTTGIDEGYDAGMFEDNNPAIALYSRIEGSDIGFAIQCLPDTDMVSMVVSLGLNAPQGSPVNLTVETTNLPAGTKVYLEDKLTGKFTRLDESGTFYTVSLSAVSNGSGRFFLHLTQGTLGIEQQVEESFTIIPLPREHKIRVLGIVTPHSPATIYEMNGSVVGSEVLNNVGENEIPFMPRSSGIYLLKIETGKTVIKRKINWVY